MSKQTSTLEQLAAKASQDANLAKGAITELRKAERAAEKAREYAEKRVTEAKQSQEALKHATINLNSAI